MAKRYIISTSNLVGEDQLKRFADRLTKNGLIWWHWLHNTWLIVDTEEKFNAASYSTALRETFPSAWFLILEYEGSAIDWAGYGPSGSGDIETDMFAWIKEHWLGHFRHAGL